MKKNAPVSGLQRSGLVVLSLLVYIVVVTIRLLLLQIQLNSETLPVGGSCDTNCIQSKGLGTSSAGPRRKSAGL